MSNKRPSRYGFGKAFFVGLMVLLPAPPVVPVCWGGEQRHFWAESYCEERAGGLRLGCLWRIGSEVVPAT
ncbi:hypothetical protein GCM10007094_08000 [Pseudovibrio japonicus]|uniref:Secreted protein n=1 Tax=Pseudovibrio japonicus TaxID=366534 RepID=A0ABQ3E3I6_9HYPH|nr:hypothetical protein GCM10007094_08000 [Pseudovibrio japonicus]